MLLKPVAIVANKTIPVIFLPMFFITMATLDL